MSTVGEELSEIWQPAGQAVSFEDAIKKVKQHEREELASILVLHGEDASLPGWEARARADGGHMAQLKGRQLREALEMLGYAPGRVPKEWCVGMAEKLKAARERVLERLRRGEPAESPW